jgi:hypothetical protein
VCQIHLLADRPPYVQLLWQKPTSGRERHCFICKSLSLIILLKLQRTAGGVKRTERLRQWRTESNWREISAVPQPWQPGISCRTAGFWISLAKSCSCSRQEIRRRYATRRFIHYCTLNKLPLYHLKVLTLSSRKHTQPPPPPPPSGFWLIYC